ncbi:MAG: hypothetical protein EPN33_13015 [Acidobacteria bacterium]|nr:MAG: hypothetical protein EPN33_13015 [Acidobacteriota bacterium]
MSPLALPEALEGDGFNRRASIPFGLTPEHVRAAMQDFLDFLTAVDSQLHSRGMISLENTMMQANFSSLVGELIANQIPRYCPTLARNVYHNGHPDLLPAGKYLGDAAQHAGANGIEIKASRYAQGWQGHNAEDAWLMVFVFRSGRNGPKLLPGQGFKFLLVAGALLSKSDWQFSGRSSTSRRTITASVKPAGAARMTANWIYKCRELRERER